MLESLVQIEAAQPEFANRTSGEDATLENDWPDSTICALPVVGKCDTASDVCVADTFVITGSG